MYHADQSHIITTDDITKLHHLSLHEENGKTFAHIIAELQPDKAFNEQDGQLRLHVTNGVSHRYLMQEEEPEQTPEETSEETPEKESEEETPPKEQSSAEENPEELTVAPVAHAARKQHKKG